MKEVSEKEWREKAAGLAEWRKNKTSPPNLDLYKKIVSMVHVGDNVLDCGAGQMHLWKCLPEHSMIKIDAHGYKSNLHYTAIDPFPIAPFCIERSAEDMRFSSEKFDSVFMLSALDNVISIEQSLIGLKTVAKENIVILTGIGIPPDENHTVQVDREDLVSVLGEPFQEVEISPKLFLFEWRL